MKPLTLALLKYFANVCYWTNNAGNKHNRDFEVSLSSIAANLGCSEATALRHIEIAAKMDLITVKRNENARNSYALHLEAMYDWPTAKDTEKQKKRKRKNDKAKYQREYRKRQEEERQKQLTDAFEAGRAAAVLADQPDKIEAIKNTDEQPDARGN